MSNDTMRNPTDQLYQNGVPVKKLKKRGYVLNDVDWEQRIESSEYNTLGAKTATSHFHYEHASHALLCKQILTHYGGADDGLQQVARTVADDAMTQLGTWSQYMNRLGGGKQLTPTLREYYTLLYREPDPMVKLIGALTIDAADVGVYRAFHGGGDDMFDKIASRFASEATFRKAKEPLKGHIANMSEAERHRLMQRSAQYIDLIGMCVDNLEDTLFLPFGYSAEQGREATGNTVKQFYNDIGLTEGIF